jgi:hypothetical protein
MATHIAITGAGFTVPVSSFYAIHVCPESMSTMSWAVWRVSVLIPLVRC